jgi:4-phospho-D-threonate 3-dehydrogenase / 4-phospho-D-erythronate 3-dehydrogenase
MKPILAITMGDINGIGPEILAKALARRETWSVCRPVVIGSAEALADARKYAAACPPPKVVERIETVGQGRAEVPVIDAGIYAPQTHPGQLEPETGRCAVEWLKAAIGMAMDGRVAGIVTCPLNKEGIHKAGYRYPGHTQIIAEMTGSPDYRMCLFSKSMRIVHISSHCSLREAITLVRRDRVLTSIRVAREALVRLGLPRQRIAVAGLNPHAGESGAFGNEEEREIAPAVLEAQASGIDCSGPYAPDTVFRSMREGQFDAVIAMYHDQGHIALKTVEMGDAVNVTLGIPIVRTSVGHGTAYDIAGKGVANEESLCAAVDLAVRLARAS